MKPAITVSSDARGEVNAPTSSLHTRWYERLLTLLQSARGLWLVTGLAALLALPSLSMGWVTDDHIARAITLAQEMPNPFTSFGFRPQPGMDRASGYLAWWSSPRLSVKFLRPLSALSHAELLLWPDAPWVGHAINVLLYAGLVALAFILYRTLLPEAPRIAACAALLFAIDDGHATAVGWVSSRNTVLYSVLALASVWLHARARRHGRRSALPSAACLALALLAGEGGIAGFAYLLAYELSFETGTIRERVARLWPHASVVALWIGIYIAGRYGVRGASFYRELSEPLFVLGSGLSDVPLWLAGLLGPSLIGAALVLPPVATRVIVAAAFLPLCVVIWRSLPRSRETRFFLLGTLLCLPPLFTTVAQDRLLMLASFGAFGVLASFIDTARSATSKAVQAVRWLMLAIHGVLSPLGFATLLAQNTPIERGAQSIVAALPLRSPPQVILVNLPVELLSLYPYYIVREQPERTPPEMFQQLYAGSAVIEVARIDSNTLELSAARGWGAAPIERIFGNLRDMPRAGDRLQLDRLEVLVRESNAEGLPTRVHFRFPSALESEERAFYVWQGVGPVRWQPPLLGQRERLAAVDMLSSLPR